MKLKLALAIAVSISQIGCATRHDDNPKELIEAGYFTKLTKEYFESDGLRKKRDDYRAHMLKGEQDLAKNLRNEIATDLMSVSDYLFDKARDKQFIYRGAVDASARMYNLLFTTIATISPVENVKTGFAAAATLLSGTKAIYDEEMFARQARATIITTMIGSRARVKEALLKNLRLPPNDFTLSEAIASVQEYHRAGSIVDALITLEQLANKEATSQINLLQKTTRENAKSESTVVSPMSKPASAP